MLVFDVIGAVANAATAIGLHPYGPGFRIVIFFLDMHIRN